MYKMNWYIKISTRKYNFNWNKYGTLCVIAKKLECKTLHQSKGGNTDWVNERQWELLSLTNQIIFNNFKNGKYQIKQFRISDKSCMNCLVRCVVQEFADLNKFFTKKLSQNSMNPNKTFRENWNIQENRSSNKRGATA